VSERHADTALCLDCGQPLSEGVDLPAAIYMGRVRAFCSEECKQHWIDDSQEGAHLKDLLT
jgi:hypothetical protein